MVGFNNELIKGPGDLVTSYEETRAGFIAMALEKNNRSNPYIARARALKVAAKKAEKPKDLLNLTSIQEPLLYAAGISEKAKKYLDNDDQKEAILSLIENFLEPSGEEFVEELIYRYLLFQGDSLGGSMRNVAGFLAQKKFTRSLIAALDVESREYYWLPNEDKSQKWIQKSKEDQELGKIENFAKGISWVGENGPKTLMYNLKIPFVGNNVDICLFNCAWKDYDKNKTPKLSEKYVLTGELKGGIDPAGADEHWKTARSALERIRKGFSQKNQSIDTIFIGAAIEKQMAEEIWGHLSKGILTNVANLTNEDQVSDLCNWIVNL